MKKISLLLFIEVSIVVVQKIEQFVATMVHDSLNRPPGHLRPMIKPRFLTEDGQLLCEIALQLSLESSLPRVVEQSHSRSLLRLHFCYHIREHVAHDCDLPDQVHWFERNVGLPVG